MDQHVKARLTGAVVVVTLGVIFIPMLLDGPDPEAGPDRSPDGNGTTLVLDLRRPEPRTPPASSAVPSPVTEDAADKGPSVAAVTEAPDRDTAADPPAVPAPAPPPPAAARDEPTVEPVVEPWAVQVGSFSRRENALRLRDNLARSGFDASVSTMEQGGRTLHRVRVGPVAGRPAAEDLARRLTDAGQVASVVPVEK